MFRARQLYFGTLIALVAMASPACSPAADTGVTTPAPATAKSPSGEPNGPDAADRVDPAELEALLHQVRERPFTLTYRLTREGKSIQGRGGLSRNGDRYFIGPNGQGLVQQGIWSWEVIRDGETLQWEGPSISGLAQLPHLARLQVHPELWGVVAAIERVPSFHRTRVTADGEEWVAVLPQEGLELPWFGLERRTLALTVNVERAADGYLPLQYEAQWQTESGAATLEGTYRWEEAELPAIPPEELAERRLGLFGIRLGDSRDLIEPILYAPTERRSEPDGTEWALKPDWGQAVQYDAQGRVIALEQTQGGLINGLAVADHPEEVKRRFGSPDASLDGLFEYRFPDGNVLQIEWDQQQVLAFRAVASSPSAPEVGGSAEYPLAPVQQAIQRLSALDADLETTLAVGYNQGGHLVAWLNLVPQHPNAAPPLSWPEVLTFVTRSFRAVPEIEGIWVVRDAQNLDLAYYPRDAFAESKLAEYTLDRHSGYVHDDWVFLAQQRWTLETAPPERKIPMAGSGSQVGSDWKAAPDLAAVVAESTRRIPGGEILFVGRGKEGESLLALQLDLPAGTNLSDARKIQMETALEAIKTPVDQVWVLVQQDNRLAASFLDRQAHQAIAGATSPISPERWPLVATRYGEEPVPPEPLSESDRMLLEVPLLAEQEQVRATLGEPAQSIISTNGTAEFWEYPERSIRLGFRRQQGNTLYRFELMAPSKPSEAPAPTTPRGVGLGSSRLQVEQAYGRPAPGDPVFPYLASPRRYVYLSKTAGVYLAFSFDAASEVEEIVLMDLFGVPALLERIESGTSP